MVADIKVRLSNTVPAELSKADALQLKIGHIVCTPDKYYLYCSNYPPVLYIEGVDSPEHPRVYEWNLAVSREESLWRRLVTPAVVRNPKQVFGQEDRKARQKACPHPALMLNLYVENSTRNFKCRLCKMRWYPGDTPEVLFLPSASFVPNHTGLGWASIFGLYKLGGPMAIDRIQRS